MNRIPHAFQHCDAVKRVKRVTVSYGYLFGSELPRMGVSVPRAEMGKAKGPWGGSWQRAFVYNISFAERVAV